LEEDKSQLAAQLRPGCSRPGRAWRELEQVRARAKETQGLLEIEQQTTRNMEVEIQELEKRVEEAGAEKERLEALVGGLRRTWRPLGGGGGAEDQGEGYQCAAPGVSGEAGEVRVQGEWCWRGSVGAWGEVRKLQGKLRESEAGREKAEGDRDEVAEAESRAEGALRGAEVTAQASAEDRVSQLENEVQELESQTREVLRRRPSWKGGLRSWQGERMSSSSRWRSRGRS